MQFAGVGPLSPGLPAWTRAPAGSGCSPAWRPGCHGTGVPHLVHLAVVERLGLVQLDLRFRSAPVLEEPNAWYVSRKESANAVHPFLKGWLVVEPHVARPSSLVGLGVRFVLKSLTGSVTLGDGDGEDEAGRYPSADPGRPGYRWMGCSRFRQCLPLWSDLLQCWVRVVFSETVNQARMFSAVAALQAVELAALDEVLGQVAAAAFAAAQHEGVQRHCYASTGGPTSALTCPPPRLMRHAWGYLALGSSFSAVLVASASFSYAAPRRRSARRRR